MSVLLLGIAGSGGMFKRLTKARRHSADEIGSVLHHHQQQQQQQSPTRLDEPPPPGGAARIVKNSAECPIQTSPTSSGNGNGYMFSPRSKFSRKSCGDAYALLTPEDEPVTTMQTGKQQAETDYRLVTAMPAFIVEHEPEKQRGLCFRCFFLSFGRGSWVVHLCRLQRFQASYLEAFRIFLSASSKCNENFSLIQ